MKTFNTIMNSCNRKCSYCYLGKNLPQDRQAFEQSVAYLKNMFKPETISTLVNGGFDRIRLMELAMQNPGMHVYIGHDQLREPGMLDFFKRQEFETSHFFVSRLNLNHESDLAWLMEGDRITASHVLGKRSQTGNQVTINIVMSKIRRHYILFEFPFSLKEYKPAILSLAKLMKHEPTKLIQMDLCWKKASGLLKIWENVDPSLEVHPDGKIRFCDYTGELYDPLKMSKEEIIEAAKICNRCPYLGT